MITLQQPDQITRLVGPNGALTIEGVKFFSNFYAKVDSLDTAIGNLDVNAVSLAEGEILSTYGDTVSVATKAKSLTKFGRNANLSTSFATVWEQGGEETYTTTNSIDSISSSDAADNAVIYLEYHTVTGTGAAATFTFGSQLATVNGQTRVAITAGARASRAYVVSGTLNGDLYVYENTAIVAGVPTDTTKIHNLILGTLGQTQSYKAATTLSNTDYAIVTGAFASVEKKTAASADFELQIRQPGGAFRPSLRLSLNSASQTTQQISLLPYLIIPKNADIRIQAIASVANVSVDATFQAYLASVV